MFIVKVIFVNAIIMICFTVLPYLTFSIHTIVLSNHSNNNNIYKVQYTLCTVLYNKKQSSFSICVIIKIK